MRKHLLRIALAAGVIGSLGACASFGNERAWANGQAMASKSAYSRAMSGDMSLSTMRQLRMDANPRNLNHREYPYAPFTHWKY